MPTTSVYPAALDNFAVHGATMDQVEQHENLHLTMEDAIEKIEAELGTDPAGTFATVKARLDTRVGAAVSRVANQNMNPGHTNISFDTEGSDPQGFITVPSTTLTVPAGFGGIYALTLRVRDQAISHGAANGSYIEITAPVGVAYRQSGNGTDVFNLALVVPIAAAGTIVCAFNNGTGAAVNIQATLDVNRVSP